MNSAAQEEQIEIIKRDYDDSEMGKFNFFQKLSELNIIPFDVQESISDNIIDFGYLGTGELVGTYVQVKSVPTFQKYDLSNSIGLVIGDFAGRIVVLLEDQYYFGWLEPNAYIIVNNYQNINSNIH